MNAPHVAEASRDYLTQLAPPLVRHFDLLAGASQGVARLRELILSLAVRGKLVPQYPADEPARVLLERIRAEKDKLIAGGKIKRDKTLPAISEQERPFELPEGWWWVRFGELTINRDSERVPVSADERGKLAKIYDYYGASGVIDKIDGYLFDKTLLLIGEDGANLLNRSTPIAFLAHGMYWVNNHAHVIDTSQREVMDYLCLFINAISLEPYVTGTAQPKMNQARLNSIVVGLPPLAEQSRIVAKVEELMGLCDLLEEKGRLKAEQHRRLVATLFDSLTSAESAHELAESWQRISAHFDLLLDRPEAVDVLEQTVLQLAVRGLLVPQDPADEPASRLLERIRSEKDRLIAAGKIKRDKPLQPLGEDERPFEVPEGWAWERFGAVITGSEAGWSPSCSNVPRTGTNWGVLKVSAVSWGEFRSQENKELPADLPSRPEYEVLPADFLISRANTEELVARSVIARTPEPKLMLSDKVIRLHLSEYVCREYLNLNNNSTWARSYYAANASGTSSSMKNVSREVIMQLPVPLPPLAEQGRIVARVEELRRLCADLRGRLSQRKDIQRALSAALVEQVAA